MRQCTLLRAGVVSLWLIAWRAAPLRRIFGDAPVKPVGVAAAVYTVASAGRTADDPEQSTGRECVLHLLRKQHWRKIL